MSKSKKPNERRIWTIEERLGFIDKHGLPHLIQGGNQVRPGEVYSLLDEGIPETIVSDKYAFRGRILRIPKFKGNREFLGWVKVNMNNPFYTGEFCRYLTNSFANSAVEDYGIKKIGASRAARKIFSSMMVIPEGENKKVRGYLSDHEKMDIHQFYSPQADITAHFLMASDKLFR